MVTQKQKSAGEMAAKLGRRLQKDHPEIYRMYLDGMMQREIASELGIAEDYSVTKGIAKVAIHYALMGFPGKTRTKHYGGLIESKEEQRRLSEEHRKMVNKRLDEQMRNEKKGIYGLTEEQRKRAIIESGWTPWIDRREEQDKTILGEADVAYLLAHSKQYTHTKGRYKGSPKWKEIKEVLEKEFHNGRSIRTKEAIYSRVFRRKKELEEKVCEL